MGEAMDHQIEVMEKMRKRLEWETGDSISLDETRGLVTTTIPSKKTLH